VTRLPYLLAFLVTAQVTLCKRWLLQTSSNDSSCSSDEGTIFRHTTRAVDGHKSVRQRQHEAHNRIFLSVRKAEPPNSALVHVFCRLGRRPACRAFTDVMGLAVWKYVARVVEVYDRLQAREISIVHIGFHKARVGPLVHIPECRHLNSGLVVRRQLDPPLINGGGLAEEGTGALGALETKSGGAFMAASARQHLGFTRWRSIRRVLDPRLALMT